MNDNIKIEDITDIGLGLPARSIEELSNTLASLRPDQYANEEFQKATYGTHSLLAHVLFLIWLHTYFVL